MGKDHEDNKFRHPEDQPLRASVNEIENFMESNPVWTDMKEWMGERKELLKQQLRKADTMEDVRGIQRALDQIDDLILLPQRFLQEQKEEQRIQKQKGK